MRSKKSSKKGKSLKTSKVKPPVKRGLSVKKRKLKNKKDWQYKKRAIYRKKLLSVIQFKPGDTIEQKIGKKVLKRKASYFINYYTNKATKASTRLEALKAKTAKKVVVKKAIISPLTGGVVIPGEVPFVLDFSAWDRAQIIAEITKTKIKKVINQDSGEVFVKNKQFPEVIFSLTETLSNMASNDILRLERLGSEISFYVVSSVDR